MASEEPEAHVPLSRVWEYPDPYAALLMRAIEERFPAAQVRLYGTLPDGRHELIRFAELIGIDWPGRPGPTGEHEPRAHRRGRYAFREGAPVYESLTMPAEHWARLCAEILPAELHSHDDQGVEPGETREPVPYGTGLPGKPTSWHLIEAECRRRYSLGERHSGAAGESRAEWTRVLAAWLRSAHPEAPPATQKTLQNRLSGLLRELAAEAENP